MSGLAYGRGDISLDFYDDLNGRIKEDSHFSGSVRELYEDSFFGP